MLLQSDDIAQLPERQRAAFINCLSGFKSANLVGTVSASGQANLALVSSVVHLGANPPLLAFISRPPSVDRHTLEYLRDTGFFTLNHVHEDMLHAAHQTSARYPRDVSEFDAVGLTPCFSTVHPAPGTLCGGKPAAHRPQGARHATDRAEQYGDGDRRDHRGTVAGRGVAG